MSSKLYIFLTFSFLLVFLSKSCLRSIAVCCYS
jgi:hypothetical protein